MTTPRVPVLARRLEVYGGLRWEQTFRFKRRVLNEAGEVVSVEVEDLSGGTGWACDWRPSAESTTELELDVVTVEAATGVVSLRAPEAATLAMGGNGVLDLRVVLAGAPRVLVRAKTAWTLGVTRD